MQICHLLKRSPQDNTVQGVDQFLLDMDGISGSAPFPKLTQLLILSDEVLHEFHLTAGALKENVVVRNLDVNALPSGTVLRLGTAEVRLTWECEPCSMIKHLVDLKEIRHKRGMLACCIRPGLLKVGDEVTVMEARFEPIPQARIPRIQWYLEQQSRPVSAAKLVYDLGLPSSTLRKLPELLSTNPQLDAHKIVL